MRLAAVFRVSPAAEANGKSREYELVLRAPSGSALAPFTHLTLTELEASQAPGGENCFELEQISATTDESPLTAARLQFVYGEPPTALPPAEFDEYYDEHLRENLQMQSFSAGWRFRNTPIHLDSEGKPPGSHLAIYRMEQEWSDASKELAAHSARLRDTWPAWFTGMGLSAISAKAL